MGAEHKKPVPAAPPPLCEDAALALAFIYAFAPLCTSAPDQLIHSVLGMTFLPIIFPNIATSPSIHWSWRQQASLPSPSLLFFGDYSPHLTSPSGFLCWSPPPLPRCFLSLS